MQEKKKEGFKKEIVMRVKLNIYYLIKFIQA